ncbi:MAG: hypothetical protein FWB83_00245 [Treponema sp.]|nr:hypothetical protein [Treponema sp.]
MELKKSGTIIAAVCIVIYLFALIQGSVRFYLSVDQRRSAADQEFTQIAALALTAGTQGFMNEQFVQTMNNALVSSKSLEALIITGPEGEYAFEKQRGNAVNWINNSPRFFNKFSFSDQSLYMPLDITGLRNVNIKAVAGAFDLAEISKILKETLLLILIGFALAFFTMLLQLLLGRQTDTASENTQAPVNEAVKSGAGPKGLYSNRSNIGWEEYIKDRLDSELHRCSSSEHDLALIFMEFTDIANDIMYKTIAEETVSFFASRDMLFEYGKWGIAVILPIDNLETAISKSEKFYQRIMERFPSSYSRASSLCIGLSSRAGRLLNADRLILETREALKKAKSDSKNKIVAFKSDPEKYREFIRTRG